MRGIHHTQVRHERHDKREVVGQEAPEGGAGVAPEGKPEAVEEVGGRAKEGAPDHCRGGRTERQGKNVRRPQQQSAAHEGKQQYEHHERARDRARKWLRVLEGKAPEPERESGGDKRSAYPQECDRAQPWLRCAKWEHEPHDRQARKYNGEAYRACDSRPKIT